MPRRGFANEQQTGIDRKKPTKTHAEQVADMKGGNRTGLVTASLRHRGFSFQLMLSSLVGEGNDEESH